MNKKLLLTAISASALTMTGCMTTGGPGTSTYLECDRGTRLQVDYMGNSAVVRVNGGPRILLRQTPAASGTSYEGGGYALREHQGTVMWNGPTREAPYTCRQVIVPR